MNVFFSGSDLLCFFYGFQVHIFVTVNELLKAKDMGDCSITDN